MMRYVNSQYDIDVLNVVFMAFSAARWNFGIEERQMIDNPTPAKITRHPKTGAIPTRKSEIDNSTPYVPEAAEQVLPDKPSNKLAGKAEQSEKNEIGIKFRD